MDRPIYECIAYDTGSELEDLKQYKKDLEKYTDFLEGERTKQLAIQGVVPMLPKMKSNEFEGYLKSSGYERIDDELLQKGKDYYCVNNVYRHFLNLIEFGN